MIKILQQRPGAILFVLLLIVIYFPIFLNLGFMPIRIWDESILGVNALEMAKNHNYIVTYFYNSPDMYRCKPPLMLWFVILSTKALGFSEFSLRLPSAIAALALCVYLYFMLKKITGNYLFGFFTVCVLVTCQGYIGLHITRTGEYDAFWLLFSSIFSLSLFTAVETEDKRVRSKHLLLFFVFLTLSVLTKGLVCMLYFLPCFFAYMLVRKKVIAIVTDKGFYTGLVFFVVFGLGYYALREIMNPGYIKAVLNNEFTLHFNSVDLELDGPFVRQHPVLFFLQRIITSQFVSYMFIFPVALYVGLKLAAPEVKKINIYAALIGCLYFVIISLIGKRVPHYDAPCIIYMSFIIASFFYTLFIVIEKQFTDWFKKPLSTQIFAFICILSLLALPYYYIIKTVYHPRDDWEGSFSESCKIFQQAAKGQNDIKNYKLIFDTTPRYGPVTVLTCYKQELAEHGIDVTFARPGELNTGDKAIVFDTTNRQQLEHIYNIETLNHLDYCNADIIQIKALRVKI